MQIDFTPEQEEKLTLAACASGVEPAQFVKGTVLRHLDEESKYLAFVEEGKRAAERGEFVDSSEVWNELQRILQN